MARAASSRSSTDAAAAGAIVVGRVVGAHGLRGQLRIRYFGEEPDELEALERIALCETEEDSQGTHYDVSQVRAGRSGELRVALEGVDDRETAESLRGHWVRIDPRALRPLDDEEYYGYELVGCRVRDQRGEAIGTLRTLWRTGAPDVLVVENEEGREHLIPAALIREVDREGRTIVVEVIPGLLEQS